MPTKHLTREEFGEAVFQAAKSEIESRGYSLWAPRFDPDYPVSLRQLSNIRKGKFDIKTVQKLPGIKAQELFMLQIE